MSVCESEGGNRLRRAGGFLYAYTRRKKTADFCAFFFKKICAIEKFYIPLRSVFPEYKRRVDDHLNISSVLAFSEQQDALIAAQQQVTQRVMDNNQMLRDALKKELSVAEHYKQLYEAERAKNKALEARVEQLEARPLSVAGDYIETQRINKYIASYKPTKRTKLRSSANDLTLPLWDNNSAISM